MTNSLPWKPWPIYRWFTSLPIKNGDFPWLTILIVRINGRFHQKMRTDGWGFVSQILERPSLKWGFDRHELGGQSTPRKHMKRSIWPRRTGGCSKKQWGWKQPRCSLLHRNRGFTDRRDALVHLGAPNRCAEILVLSLKWLSTLEWLEAQKPTLHLDKGYSFASRLVPSSMCYTLFGRLHGSSPYICCWSKASKHGHLFPTLHGLTCWI